MANKGVTYDQIVNAAEAVKARGLKPTVQLVRVELGDTGSFTTISQGLAKWHGEQAEKGAKQTAIPPEAENAMLTAMTTIWTLACEQAQNDLAEAKQTAKDKLTEKDAELKEAQDEITRLETELASAQQALEEEKGHADKARAALLKAEATAHATRESYQELLKTIKQPDASAPDAGKKSARAKPTKGASGSTPDANPAH